MPGWGTLLICPGGYGGAAATFSPIMIPVVQTKLECISRTWVCGDDVLRTSYLLRSLESAPIVEGALKLPYEWSVIIRFKPISLHGKSASSCLYNVCCFCAIRDILRILRV